MTAAIIVISILALVLALLIYPGEMSHVSTYLNRRLYDCAAARYALKWLSDAYRDPLVQNRIVEFARVSCQRSENTTVLDLGCGSGRGIRLVADALTPETEFVGVDFSRAMLDEFRAWLQEQGGSLASRVRIVEADLADWTKQEREIEAFGLVMMLEVGEFLPGFAKVMSRVAEITARGGGLILTRPANHWWLFFPGRKQSRKAMSELLDSLGFEEPTFVKWRSRYELVFSRRA